MPNAVAYLMLAIWPAVVVALFRFSRLERALIWSILGGYLLLPPIAAFDLPLVPPLDKVSIPTLAACAVLVVIGAAPDRRLRASKTERVLLLSFVIGLFATVLTNGEPIVFSQGGIPGLRFYDSLSEIAQQAIVVIPFFLARRFLASVEAQRDLLVALVVAGLAYSLPILAEVRLSPQLNVWIYGFFQHSFDQMMRGGGFRPIVFLEHGLWVAFFALTTLLAAMSLTRRAAEGAFNGASKGVSLRYAAAAAYLAVVLVLCKSYASLAYALALTPLVLAAGPSLQLRIAALLAAIAIAYPLLRGAGLVPVDFLVEQASRLNTDRAASLAYRFANEDRLLAHAGEKPLFGWGSWGRNHVYDADGNMTTVSDGRWIIVIGLRGWTGYIAEFGLIGLPLLLLGLRAARARLSPYAGPLALILGVNMIDMLPNATLTPFTWLVAGALTGYAQTLRGGARAAAPALRPYPIATLR